MKQEKFTALEFLEKLTDSVEDQIYLNEDNIITLLMDSKNLDFSEKEKKEIHKNLYKIDMLRTMRDGLDWYQESTRKLKND